MTGGAKRLIKYGGVEFEALRSPEEINTFVAGLPEAERQSLRDVVKRLEERGYIRIPEEPEFGTIDRDYEALARKEGMEHEEMGRRLDGILWQAEDRPEDGE